ncbi:ATP-dependent RNA helicase HAS1 [Folsomia candida]|uniref:ATP-dependent RNA helicase HAS1 n=1 Tax=Folsomia candida TaxID=158441 RepID=A0A226DJN2_FOLCA|nr:ATP-dependent RNA helicase HAS1 [Folsomia candida]
MQIFHIFQFCFLLHILHCAEGGQGHVTRRKFSRVWREEDDPEDENVLRRRAASGFPVRYFDTEENGQQHPAGSHYLDEEAEESSPSSSPLDDTSSHHVSSSSSPSRDDPAFFDDDDEFDPSEPAPATSGDAATQPGSSPGIKQDENPLNFLNLAGTDFQPGRMVNIFFGLMIMVFMIVIHGYILWIVGIAYLPGTRRSLGDWGGLDVDTDVMLDLVTSVVEAVAYWDDKQNLHVDKD